MRAILFLLLSLPVAAADFDVLLWKDTANPSGIPGEWPAKVQPAAGRESPWVKMTAEELESHKARHRQEYDAWKVSHEASRQAAEVKLTAIERLETEPELRAFLEAVSRFLAAELNTLRTNRNQLEPTTYEQARDSILSHAKAALNELVTANTANTRIVERVQKSNDSIPEETKDGGR